jgi:hypothetical protein
VHFIKMYNSNKMWMDNGFGEKNKLVKVKMNGKRWNQY